MWCNRTFVRFLISETTVFMSLPLGSKWDEADLTAHRPRPHARAWPYCQRRIQVSRPAPRVRVGV